MSTYAASMIINKQLHENLLKISYHYKKGHYQYFFLSFYETDFVNKIHERECTTVWHETVSQNVAFVY